MQNWRENLNNIMKERGTNARRVSLSIGKSEDYVTKLLKLNTPSIEAFSDIAEHLGVSIVSLYYGPTCDELTTQLIDEFSKLNEEEKIYALKILKGFSKT